MLGGFSYKFNFEIIYRCGKENVVADTLSRSMWNQELKELNTMAKHDMAVAKRLNLIFIPEGRQKIFCKYHTDP